MYILQITAELLVVPVLIAVILALGHFLQKRIEAKHIREQQELNLWADQLDAVGLDGQGLRNAPRGEASK